MYSSPQCAIKNDDCKIKALPQTTDCVVNTRTFIGGGCWRKDAVDDANELAQPIALLPGDCLMSGFGGGNIHPSGVIA